MTLKAKIKEWKKYKREVGKYIKHWESQLDANTTNDEGDDDGDDDDPGSNPGSPPPPPPPITGP